MGIIVVSIEKDIFKAFSHTAPDDLRSYERQVRSQISREKPNPIKGVTVLVEVKKKDGESFESLLRRFNRKIQQSGVLVRARKTRFYEPAKSKLIVREDARRRAASRVRREELKKSGKLPVRRGFGKKF